MTWFSLCGIAETWFEQAFSFERLLLSYTASMPPTIGRLILLHNPCAWYIDTVLFARWDLKYWDRVIPISVFNWRIKVNFPFFNWLTLHRFSGDCSPKPSQGIEPCQSQSRDRCLTCVVQGILRTLELFTKVEGFLMWLSSWNGTLSRSVWQLLRI